MGPALPKPPEIQGRVFQNRRSGCDQLMQNNTSARAKHGDRKWNNLYEVCEDVDGIILHDHRSLTERRRTAARKAGATKVSTTSWRS